MNIGIKNIYDFKQIYAENKTLFTFSELILCFFFQIFNSLYLNGTSMDAFY